jgi:predicted nucleic acid-binding protein
MAGSFIDSNVVIYLASGEADRAGRAETVLAETAVIGVQVLNETANVLRRKLGFSWSDIREFLAALRELVDVVPLTQETHDRALELAERHGFAFYDALIVAAALEAGCERLWSEDMHDGMVVEGTLTIRNPFRTIG